MFPDLRDLRRAHVDLEAEAARFEASHPELFSAGRNPLLDPAVCQRMMDGLHARLDVSWSYGGYLEDRRRLWRGSYLEQTGHFLHLGIDCTVPRATRVAASFSSTVILVDLDPDQDGGWGARVFLASGSLVFIYAHLQNPAVEPGQLLAPGDIIAQVGGPPENGNWHPHLHVQAVRADHFHEILRDRFHQLDGYGPAHTLPTLRRDFPDPLPYFSSLIHSHLRSDGEPLA